MYRCAIIGVSGYRANGHAQAYQHIRRGQLVAICTRRRENLNAFGEKYGVASRYTDYRELFLREKPDLVHVNTPPTLRAEVIEAAISAGIPALVIEKPIGIQGEDYRVLRSLAGRGNVKVAVNHQLHFHPNRHALQERVAAGEIGGVCFIDASAVLNLAFQGTHMLQAIGAFNQGGKARAVFAAVAGAKGLAESPRAHFAPDQAVAEITYDNGCRALLRCGPGAPIVRADQQPPFHKRVAIYGDCGQAHWSMWGWSLSCTDGHTESGEHDYFEQDVRAQAALTEAMFDWIEDDARVHPLNLTAALDDLEIVLAAYTSAIERRVVELPFNPPASLIESLRQSLNANVTTG